jgi:Arc/MetJ-type ribon-helix-helix transcriptional regulator
MLRIQLHLTEQQDRRLRALARRRGSARADLIRQGIDLLLQKEAGQDDPLLALVGAAGPAGRSDVSERHDDILYRRPSAKARQGR